MNGTDEVAVIKGEAVKKTVYNCPKCGKDYPSEGKAKTCLAVNTFLTLINSMYTEGEFLLKGEEVISVYQVKIVLRDCCGDSCVLITLVSSNDTYHIDRYNVEKWLEAGIRNISLTEAVERGWRAVYRRVWEQKATPEMDAEYRAAIDKIIRRLAPKRQRELLQEALMFPQLVDGKPRLD